MKQLNKIESTILLLGSVLMVVGSAARIFQQVWGCYVFTTGALAFCLMQFRQSYEGRSFVIRRLRRIMLMSDVCFLLAALLMVAGEGNPLRLDAMTYIRYVNNNWVLALLIGAMLQLYSTHRISKELSKQDEQ